MASLFVHKSYLTSSSKIEMVSSEESTKYSDSDPSGLSKKFAVDIALTTHFLPDPLAGDTGRHFLSYLPLSEVSSFLRSSKSEFSHTEILEHRMRDSRVACFKDIQTYRTRTGHYFRSTEVEELDLAGSNITDAELNELLKCFPSVKKINLSGCPNVSNATLLLLRQKCKNLRSLNLSSCNIGNVGIANLCGDIRNISLLKELDISNTNITDPALRSISLVCPLMESLNLARCNISDVGIADIRGCFFLKSVILNGCSAITDLSLQYLSETFPYLKELELNGCTEITDLGLRHLGEHSEDLTILNIGGCNKISDVGIEALSKGCPLLINLSCEGCTRISDKGLINIVVLCQELQFLFLQGTSITPTGLTLSERIPKRVLVVGPNSEIILSASQEEEELVEES